MFGASNMKILVEYDDQLYLVKSETKDLDFDKLFDIVNEGRYPDECQLIKHIEKYANKIAYMTDESEFLTGPGY